jgi:hypothetical protein
MLSLCSISSMVRGFWQTVHGNKLTCYGSSEGSRMRSPINVVIAQHIVHAERVLTGQYGGGLGLLAVACT